jgi:hypothetical protein
MPGFAGLAGPAAALWRYYLSSAPLLPYRQRPAAANNRTSTFGEMPTGTHDAGDDPVENAEIDSTVDAGTGYQGGYATPFSVHALIKRGDAQAVYAQYGLQLDELATYALLSAAEVTPTRGDFITALDGSIYVVSEQQRPVTVLDQIIGYAVQVERRAPGDPIDSL